MWKFLGPGFLVSVGYMDPGNWATDIQGGSEFGYKLLWVILLSNLIAILLQILCARLGIVGQKDLAQACGSLFKKPTSVLLWLLAEIAIIATDVAEVIGSAIALELLFGIPKVVGVLVTGLDVLVILGLMKYGFRKLEAIIIAMIGTVAVCFLINLLVVKPDMLQAFAHLIPREKPSGAELGVAIGIIGATVMPHNLYLHSAVVQTRDFDDTKVAVKYSTIDTVVALSSAFFVNASILLLAAGAFYTTGKVVTELEQAHELLKPLLGGVSATLLAVALLACGQSSTITGTLAGQIVMEGFMKWKLPPWQRRMITRGLALIPAVMIVLMANHRNIDGLVLSQIILSLQLPFAIFPLIYFTASKKVMGEFASAKWVTALGLISGLLITALNFQFLIEKFGAAPIAVVAVVILGFIAWAQFVWKPRVSHT